MKTKAMMTEVSGGRGGPDSSMLGSDDEGEWYGGVESSTGRFTCHSLVPGMRRKIILSGLRQNVRNFVLPFSLRFLGSQY